MNHAESAPMNQGIILAPIVIFTFNRPNHTQRLLASLERNPEYLKSDVFIFCDGPRQPSDTELTEATRQIVDAWEHPRKTVYKHDRNIGLAKSVIEGVTRVCNEYGQAIILEDDLEISSGFLNYMNCALTRYRDDERILQISGHMFNIEIKTNDDAIFLPFPTSWGWATWRRAWQKFESVTPDVWKELDDRPARRHFDLDGTYPYTRMLKRQLDGKINSWAIQWRVAFFRHDGLALYPSSTLVINKGFDGTGTHCGVSADSVETPLEVNASTRYKLPEVEVDADAYSRIKSHLKNNNSSFARLRRKLAQIFAN